MIHLAEPNMGANEARYAADAIRSNWVGPDGKYVRTFEEMVAAAAGRRWAAATITGTAALHLAAYVLWGPRPCFGVMADSFTAMANVRRILHGFGPVREGGKNHDLAVYKCGYKAIADRAPAIGEPPPEQRSSLECYSFAANKIVTCGHGGAVVGDDIELELKVRHEIKQGYGRQGAFNYRMANLNAAIGCAQMERLAELKEKKRSIWRRYQEAGLPMVDRGASRWMSTIEVSARTAHRLTDRGIEARYEPSGVSIPCGTGLTEKQQTHVIEVCQELLAL